MFKILSRIAAAAAFMVLCLGGAMAQTYPATITGTWTIRANDTQLFTFTVDTQSTDAPCAAITGVLGAPNDTIVGYYCPITGGVSFLRNSVQTGATYQVFTGQLSWTGATTYMNGIFSNYAGSGNTGAYGFTATIKKS